MRRRRARGIVGIVTRSAARRAALALLAGVAIVVSPLVRGTTIGDEPAPCPPKTPLAGMSVARRWDEALLSAIRRALPNPPVHARNLFHLSVAMWDAWATYDPTARGYLTTEKIVARNPDQARVEAMSFPAWGVLRSRFRNAAGGDDSLQEFDAVL